MHGSIKTILTKTFDKIEDDRLLKTFEGEACHRYNFHKEAGVEVKIFLLCSFFV